MVDFPVYGFDMTPHLANKHNTINNHTNLSDQPNSVILPNVGWSPWKRARKQSNANDNVYDLYAVCYHHGTDLETGHYTAACRNPYDNNWYLYDDAKVTNLSAQNDDVGSELVNNSAYILFYQRRTAVSCSSNSSAASTSSVGSGGDHWVARMPKFTIPKTLKNIEKKPTPKTNETAENAQTEAKNQPEQPENENDAKNVSKNEENAVILRNSQNALYNSANNLHSRKSLENKSTNTSSEKPRNSDHSTAESAENLKKPSENSKLFENDVSKKQPVPIYTTSIYINSSGNVDISTTCKNSSPVLSEYRVNGLSEQDVAFNGERRGEKMYRTTAAVHRYSDLDRPEKRYHSDGGSVGNHHMSWVSDNNFFCKKLHILIARERKVIRSGIEVSNITRISLN